MLAMLNEVDWEWLNFFVFVVIKYGCCEVDEPNRNKYGIIK